MAKEKFSSEKKKKVRNFIPLIIILVFLLAIPLLFINYQTKRSGLGYREVLMRLVKKSADSADFFGTRKQDELTGEKIDFLVSSPNLLKSFSENAVRYSMRFDLAPVMEEWKLLLKDL